MNVLFDDNRFPGEKPYPYVGACRARGFAPVCVAYVSSLNRHAWPAEANHAHPPTEPAVRAVARIAADAGRPLIFDIENQDGTVLPVTADMVRWATEEGVKAVYGYAVPQWIPAVPGLAGACFTFYNENASALSGGESWFAAVDDAERMLAGDPRPRLAFVTPLWAIFWLDQEPYAGVRHLNGTPVDLALWRRQIERLRDGGWDVVFWHTGEVAPVAAHMDILEELMAETNDANLPDLPAMTQADFLKLHEAVAAEMNRRQAEKRGELSELDAAERAAVEGAEE